MQGIKLFDVIQGVANHLVENGTVRQNGAQHKLAVPDSSFTLDIRMGFFQQLAKSFPVRFQDRD